MNAAEIARALGGKRIGSDGWWQCPCPAHEDKNPSLNLKDAVHGGRLCVSLKCHAGCSREEITDALRSMGLWKGRGRPSAASASAFKNADQPRQEGEPSMYRVAMRTWRAAQPAGGTLVETYLRSRGIRLPVPPALRFAPSLRHRPSNNSWPAMVALVTRPKYEAVHRTWLARNGSGKADVDQNKMSLSAVSGGMIRLTPIARVLGIAEGIETALSVTQLTDIACWSAISAGNFDNIEVPAGVREVHVFADDDAAGIAHAWSAIRKWEASGLKTFLRLPPEGFNDYNDVLTGTPKR